MKEHLLHFIWQNKLFNTLDLTTTDGDILQIIHAGKINKNGGPDFIQAQIKIDNITLVGNIEIHLRTSDWIQHQHTTDRKYQNVILHVVYINDNNNVPIPTVELNGRISKKLLERYNFFQHHNDTQQLVCKNAWHEIDNITIDNWKESLMVERLERKSTIIIEKLNANNNNWEQTLYNLTGKYFGAHINYYPFELLVTYIDYKIILKHQHDIFQIEAMLFGVAGFLNKDFVDTYPKALKEEYQFLKYKYNLNDVPEYHWQFLRIRPSSFPTIRIALFAQLIQKMPLFSNLKNPEQFFDLIKDLEVSEYWQSHYLPDKLSTYKHKTIGQNFAQTIYINVVVPILYTYAKQHQHTELLYAALDYLSQIQPESNSKIKLFRSAAIAINNSLDSQAILELYDNYCTTKRCLDCRIGNKILRNSVVIAK